MVNTINDVLRDKGNTVVTVKPEETVYKALELMAENNIGAVIVLDNDSIAGIVSEREYARKVILKSRSSLDTPIAEIMNKDVFCVSADMKIEEGMALMTNERCRHVPVVEEGKLAGVVSIGDLVHAIICKQGFKIEQLEGYILND